MKKTKVAVIFGGVSSEHEVSRMSVTSVLQNLDVEKYEILKIGIKKDGSWWLFEGDISLILDGSWELHPANRPCAVLADSSSHGLFLPCENRSLPVDVIFPVLHGKNGEDGTIQGLFEMAQIPYVGCGVLSSAVCMDKGVTNTLLESAGIPQAAFVWFYTYDYRRDPQKYIETSEQKLGYPVFVKPANAGSSVGVSKATCRRELEQAIEIAAAEDAKIVIEEGISGVELECAVMGNEEPIASLVGEVVPGHAFYDYNDKYVDNASQLHIPARIEKDTAERVRSQAVTAYRLLGCRGLARVDFFVRNSDGAVLLNELNTLPGFTSISMYPKLFAAYGIPYRDLLDQLICYALERRGENA